MAPERVGPDVAATATAHQAAQTAGPRADHGGAQGRPRDPAAGAPGRPQGLHGGRPQGRLPRQPLGHRRAAPRRRSPLQGDLRAQQGPAPARRPPPRAGPADPAGLEPRDARRRRGRAAHGQPAPGGRPHAAVAVAVPGGRRHRAPPVPPTPPTRCRSACSAPACSPPARSARWPSSAAGASGRGPTRRSRSSCAAGPPRRGRPSSTVRCATSSPPAARPRSPCPRRTPPPWTTQAVTLRLAPAVPDTVGEWRTDDDGQTWVRDFFEATDDLEGEVSPYPALVSLGVDHEGRDVLVDLEAAGGVVAVDGDPTVASEVAAALALQSGTSSWSTDVRVTATGLPEGLTGIGDARIRVVGDLGRRDHRPRAGAGGRARRRAHRSGRARRVGALAARGGRRSARRRAVRAAGRAHRARAAVAVGRARRGHPAARWTLHVDSAGHLRLEELGISVTANRIGHQQVEAVAALFEAARRPDSPDEGGRVRDPAAGPPRRRRRVGDRAAPRRCARRRRGHRCAARRGRPVRPADGAGRAPRAAPRGRAPARARGRALAARRDR